MNNSSYSRRPSRTFQLSSAVASLGMLLLAGVSSASLVACADQESVENAGKSGAKPTATTTVDERNDPPRNDADGAAFDPSLAAAAIADAVVPVYLVGVESSGNLCVMDARNGKRIASYEGDFSDALVSHNTIIAAQPSDVTSSHLIALKLDTDKLDEVSRVEIVGAMPRLLDAGGTLLSLSYYNGPLLSASTLEGASSSRYWMDPEGVASVSGALGTELYSLHRLGTQWLVRKTIASATTLVDESKSDVVIDSIGGGDCGAKIVAAGQSLVTVAAGQGELSLRDLDGVHVATSTTESDACVEDAISTGHEGEVLALTGPTPVLHRSGSADAGTLLLKASMAHLTGPEHRLVTHAPLGMAWVTFDGDVRAVSIKPGAPMSEIESFSPGCAVRTLAVLTPTHSPAAK